MEENEQRFREQWGNVKGTETKAVPSPTIATGGGNGGGKTSAQQLKMP